jgi:porin
VNAHPAPQNPLASIIKTWRPFGIQQQPAAESQCMRIVPMKYAVPVALLAILAVSSVRIGAAEEFLYDADPEPTALVDGFADNADAGTVNNEYVAAGDGAAAVPGCSCSCACRSAAPPPPPPQFGGCCCCRPKLTGDWWCHRNCLAENGVTLDADVTQFYFGVTEGGLDRRFDYGGHGDYVMNFDMGKLGVHQGLFLKLRAEHRFGQSISDDIGSFIPATVLPDLPVRDHEDLYLTNVLFTQALSESFAVFAGKMDTLDGDANAFAHKRGKDQFSNLAFVGNPVFLRTIPYSTLGAGFTILREAEPIFTYSILNSTDTTRTSGFDELFEEGVAMATELRLPTCFFGLPGHQLFGGAWNSQDFVSLGQDPRIVLPDFPIEEHSGSWGLYWNFDQYLYVDPCDPKRGWGVFGRAGIAEDEVVPLLYFLSAGVGGNSTIRGREADTFGVGYYYAGISEEIGPIATTLLGPLGDGQGVELFYNIEVTPWFHLTPDLQVLMPFREEVDTAVVVGLRGKIDF